MSSYLVDGEEVQRASQLLQHVSSNVEVAQASSNAHAPTGTHKAGDVLQFRDEQGAQRCGAAKAFLALGSRVFVQLALHTLVDEGRWVATDEMAIASVDVVEDAVPFIVDDDNLIHTPRRRRG